MLVARVGLRVTTGRRPGLSVAPDLARALELEPAPQVQVAFGTRQAQLPLGVEAALPPGTIALAGQSAARLHLPRALPELTVCRRERGLRFGALIGNLVPSRWMERMVRGEPGAMHRQFGRLAAECGGLLCFFSPLDIRFRTRTVRACYLNGDAWEVGVTPLPRVFFERAKLLERNWARLHRRLRRALTVTGEVRPLNPAVANTKLHDIAGLAEVETVRPLLPATRPLTLRSLREFTGEYPVVYLKPTNLNMGKGVTRLHREGDNWLVQTQTQDGIRTRTRRRLNGVLKSLRRGTPYLVQEGLDLASYLGNPYDVRLAVQKDGGGVWRVTGMVARVAPAGGVITSPRSGGEVGPPLRVLCHSFGVDGGAALLEELKAAGLAVARAAEKQFGPCGQLGLDMAVTQGGQIKLIEVNYRPVMVSQTRLGDPEVMGRVYLYPIAYACHLDLVQP